ncbi:MAG: hypothetical protein V1897_12340 [Pseudomonadota bacterium]
MFDTNKLSRVLSPMLQKGIVFRTSTGISVRSLLEDELQLSSDIVENQIATVFINGQPVDNIDSAIVRENSEIALSGPMPGFVGATMRRGGYYSAMRSGITHTDENLPIKTGQGLIKIKLYNTLIHLLGPILFSRGFFVSVCDRDELLATEIGPLIATHPDKDLQDLVFISRSRTHSNT